MDNKVWRSGDVKGGSEGGVMKILCEIFGMLCCALAFISFFFPSVPCAYFGFFGFGALGILLLGA
jgi:hypothetical protein